MAMSTSRNGNEPQTSQCQEKIYDVHLVSDYLYTHAHAKRPLKCQLTMPNSIHPQKEKYTPTIAIKVPDTQSHPYYHQ